MITRRNVVTGAAGLAGSLLVPKRAPAQSVGVPGKIIYSRSGDIWQWSNGNEDKLIADGAATSPRWSPDGSQILFVRSGNSYSDLYIRSLSSGSDFQLTFNQPDSFDPGSKDYAENSVWAVDPSWASTGLIGYASDYYTPYGLLSLWLIDGPGNSPVLSAAYNVDQGVENICLSSDGSVAAFTSRYADEDTAEYVSYVGIQDLGSGEAFPLVDDPGGSFFPSIDPNGEQVALTIRTGDQSDIWVVARDGGDRTPITDGAQAINPSYSSDGNWIGYFRMVDYRFELWATPVLNGTSGTAIKIVAADDLDPASGISWQI